MTDRTTEESIQAATQAWLRCREDRHSPPSPSEVWAAALQWQAEQQKGEALPKIASEVRIMLGSATELFDGIGDIVGYQIKTGALHRILGLLSGAGHPVAIAAKNQSVALAASPHGVPPGYVLAPVEPTDEMEAMAENAYEAASSPFPDWKAAYRAMLSSLPQAPQGEQWRPIETAPKDGTPIIVSWPMRELDDDDAPTGPITSRSTLVTWMNGGCWIEPDYLGASGEWVGDNDAFADEPDLWQPIPDPPPLAQGDSQ